jgi:hypothetical protein
MPDLKQSLLGLDLGHLRIIAEQWGLPLAAPDTQEGLSTLVDCLLDAKLLAEVVEALPEQALLGLSSLYHEKGRIPWSQFTRRFGKIQEMGPGRRDRKRPDRAPASAVEVLWYHALVARAFFETARGSEEFAYIPEDLLPLIPQTSIIEKYTHRKTSLRISGREATAAEKFSPIPATDRILDHSCTLLAGLRVGIDTISLETYPQDFIHAQLNHAGIVDSKGVPNLEATRKFLGAPRGEALTQLATTWLNSPDINDLHHVPNLKPEGEWVNDPLEARNFILQMVSMLPLGTWWSISSFLADIQQHFPDFQRPAGDYDSWFIRDTRTGEFLRGFDHWNEVDGALIRYLITGPMHWLGIMDLASPENEQLVTSFRFSHWAADLINGVPPPDLAEENAQVHIRSDGRVNVPILVPRTVRYQISRFCVWEEEKSQEYRYRLSPSSLARAQESGLSINHLLSLLRHHAGTIPPNIITALDRWDKNGTQVRVQNVTILRLGSPQILQTLRESRAARFLGDPLGPATIMIKPGSGEKVLAILSEMGYFGEVVSDS